MTKFPWLDHYPASTKPEIPEVPYSNLADMIRKVANEHRNREAFNQCMPNGMNGHLTFEQVDSYSDQFAAYLREDVGLQTGDRVAVQLPNCLAYPVVAFGIFKAGCVLVNTNPLYTASEMTHQFSDSGAKVLVIINMFADRVPKVLNKYKIEKVVTVAISEFFPSLVAAIIWQFQKFWEFSLPKIEIEHTKFQDALASGKSKLSSDKMTSYLEGIDHSSLAALQYTGGTTGVSKGAMLSHGNILSNTAQMLEMAGHNIESTKEIVLTALPLYHIFAFTVNLLAFYQTGCKNILIPSPRPPSNLKRAFENYPITWISGVNTLFNALLNEHWFREHPPTHLRAAAAGGMALQSAVAERWKEVTNTVAVEGFGLTESSPVLTFNPLGGTIKANSIGIPVPSTEVAIFDPDGNPVPVGEAGEIMARGPQIMQGYWQRPDETEKTIKDGWLHTGDIGKMDEDGYFFIVDRKKDMILVSGFNVFPNEVEDCLARHEAVDEVAVIGVPDEKSGEAVWAYVVPKQPPPKDSDLVRWCKEHLAGYKVPRKVHFRDELPKSPIGKILRKDLRKEVTGGISESVPPETLGVTAESVGVPTRPPGAKVEEE